MKQTDEWNEGTVRAALLCMTIVFLVLVVAGVGLRYAKVLLDHFWKLGV